MSAVITALRILLGGVALWLAGVFFIYGLERRREGEGWWVNATLTVVLLLIAAVLLAQLHVLRSQL